MALRDVKTVSAAKSVPVWFVETLGSRIMTSSPTQALLVTCSYAPHQHFNKDEHF